MSEQATDTAVANADTASTGDIDAQMDQMRQAEGAEQDTQPGAEGQDTQPGAEGKEGQQPATQKTVPLAALHEERRARQALARQLEESNIRMAKVDERLEKLFQPRQQAIDPNEQPVAYLDQKIDGISQRQDAIMRQQQEQREQEHQRAQVSAVVGAVNHAEAEFKKTAPDFDASVEHLNGLRARELAVLGLPEDQARQQAEMELAQASLTWAAQGRNPAATAYELAKAKGYSPRPNTEQRMETQQRGTAAAKSLGGGGAVNGGRLTAEALAKMSDEDFSKLTESQFRQAMGG